MTASEIGYAPRGADLVVRGATAQKLRSTPSATSSRNGRDTVTTRTTAPRACRARKGPRALVVLGVAATLALLAAGLLVNSGSALAAVGDITEYAVPTASSTPNYITAGPDGNLWFTESLGNRVAQVTTSAVSYTHLRAHETRHELVCRLLLE